MKESRPSDSYRCNGQNRQQYVGRWQIGSANVNIGYRDPRTRKSHRAGSKYMPHDRGGGYIPTVRDTMRSQALSNATNIVFGAFRRNTSHGG